MRGLNVRVIEYTHDDPGRPGAGERHRLITDVTNPEDLPASETPLVYHERWEKELAFANARAALSPRAGAITCADVDSRRSKRSYPRDQAYCDRATRDFPSILERRNECLNRRENCGGRDQDKLLRRISARTYHCERGFELGLTRGRFKIDRR
jgi:hypothetical protein